MERFLFFSMDLDFERLLRLWDRSRLFLSTDLDLNRLLLL